MWVDVEQNTDYWFDLRKGKATSSNFSKVMANYGKPFGDPAIKYAEKLALEIVTGVVDSSESYSNKYMDMGHEYEPVAVSRYEEETFNSTSNGGFFYKNRLGDSPDRNVGKKGCLEVKTVIPSTHFIRLKKGGYDTAYKWQIHGHMWLGDKEWCDFVSYCPFMPHNKQLYHYRVYRDEAYIDMLKSRFSLFFKEVDNNINLLSQ